MTVSVDAVANSCKKSSLSKTDSKNDIHLPFHNDNDDNNTNDGNTHHVNSFINSDIRIRKNTDADISLSTVDTSHAEISNGSSSVCQEGDAVPNSHNGLSTGGDANQHKWGYQQKPKFDNRFERYNFYVLDVNYCTNFSCVITVIYL